MPYLRVLLSFLVMSCLEKGMDGCMGVRGTFTFDNQ
jgi:hypothetical protein